MIINFYKKVYIISVLVLDFVLQFYHIIPEVHFFILIQFLVEYINKDQSVYMNDLLFIIKINKLNQYQKI